METAYLRWWSCGAFDVLFGDVNIAFDPYLFDENLEKAEPIYDYIFVSHEHFDHCHPKTLGKLCQGYRFKKLYVNPGCIHPNEPIAENYGDAAFERDLPITKHVPNDRVEIIYPKHLAESQGLDREFPGPFELELGLLHVEAIESGENQTPEIPTCGYLVTHREKGISFLHTGDLHEPYPNLANLRGRVEILIHMKLGLTEWEGQDISARLLQLLDLIEPQFLIPTHYRTDRKSDPIPEGHWPPGRHRRQRLHRMDSPGSRKPHRSAPLHRRHRIRVGTPFQAGALEMELELEKDLGRAAAVAGGMG